MLGHPPALDAGLVAVGVAAGLAFPIGPRGFDPGHQRGPLGLYLLVVLAQTVPLLWRRRWPLPVLAASFLAMFLAPALGVAESAAASGSTVALFSASTRLPPWRSLPVTLLVAAANVPYFAMAGTQDQGLPRPALPVVGAAGSLLVWGAGVAVRWRRAREAALRRAFEAQARAEERARIARELQDVVAQHVATIVVQAGAASRVLDSDPATARRALAFIQATGGQTLTAMRRLLGVLRAVDAPGAPEAPQPTTAQLEALVERYRAAGLPVTLAVNGRPVPVPPDVDLCAYRIVQEALGNCLRHARPSRVEVDLSYRPRELVVAIRDDGRGGHPGPDGHGLIGMRERVALSGGDLQVGPRNGDGWLVRASFPTGPP